MRHYGVLLASAAVLAAAPAMAQERVAMADTTHVGDSGSSNTAGPVPYALNIINDIP